MKQSLIQTKQLRQSQVLAPQQLHALELLAMPVLELQPYINRAIEENPILECLPSKNDDNLNDKLAEITSKQDEDVDRSLQEGIVPPDDWLLKDWQPGRSNGWNHCESEEARQFFLDSLHSQKSLSDALLEQLRTSDCDTDQAVLAECIIGHIDDSGYLRVNLSELASAYKTTAKKLQTALKLIQSFDPPGVGARDLAECLLLQLEQLSEKQPLAVSLVKRYWKELLHKRLPELSKRLHTPIHRLERAIDVIKRLNPRPGNRFLSGKTHYIVPDLLVERNGRGYTIVSTQNRIAQLRISAFYLDLLQHPDTVREVRQYIREKIWKGTKLIENLYQREQTLIRVMEIILREQASFFNDEFGTFKPLTLKQVADEMNLHETTISRSIAKKYVETPKGIFALKEFFPRTIRQKDGAVLSSMNIKRKIQDLIREEDPTNPLNDRKIAEQLRKKGIRLSRRTIAKYREKLDILGSRLRKKYHPVY